MTDLDDAMDRVIYQGHTFDKMTLAAVHAIETELGYEQGSLEIIQGSYNTSVSASAGTHSGGGAVDLTPDNWQVKQPAARKVGFAAWHRTAIPGVWEEHIHCILIGNPALSYEAAEQVPEYYAHRDGLADNAPDDSWHPDPQPVFKYDAKPVGTPIRLDLLRKMATRPGHRAWTKAGKAALWTLCEVARSRGFSLQGHRTGYYDKAVVRFIQQVQTNHFGRTNKRGLFGTRTAAVLGLVDSTPDKPEKKTAAAAGAAFPVEPKVLVASNTGGITAALVVVALGVLHHYVIKEHIPQDVQVSLGIIVTGLVTQGATLMGGYITRHEARPVEPAPAPPAVDVAALARQTANRIVALQITAKPQPPPPVAPAAARDSRGRFVKKG